MVDVVVLLRPLSDDVLPTPAQSKKIVTAVLRNASKETGLQPASSAVFEHLNSFSMRASARFIDAVARAQEVAQVLANDIEVPTLIASVRKKAAALKK